MASALLEEDEELHRSQYSTVILVETDTFELINYIKLMMLDEHDIDKLPRDNLLIFSRIATVTFICSPASRDVE